MHYTAHYSSIDRDQAAVDFILQRSPQGIPKADPIAGRHQGNFARLERPHAEAGGTVMVRRIGILVTRQSAIYQGNAPAFRVLVKLDVVAEHVADSLSTVRHVFEQLGIELKNQ